MNISMLAKIHQQELRAEADRERLVRLARGGQAERRQTVDGRRSLATRLRTLAADLRRPRPPVDRSTGAA